MTGLITGNETGRARRVIYRQRGAKCWCPSVAVAHDSYAGERYVLPWVIVANSAVYLCDHVLSSRLTLYSIHAFTPRRPRYTTWYCCTLSSTQSRDVHRLFEPSYGR